MKISNFELDEKNPKNLIFKGQLKKKQAKVENYSIPLLAPRPLVLSAFSKLSGEGEDLKQDKFYQSVNRHSHWLFKHKIHALRAKYCSLIMTREGVLDSNSRLEPLARAKELLGHTTQSDATFSYRQYAVNKRKVDLKKMDTMTQNLSLYEREGEKHIRIGFLKIEDELEKIIPSLWLKEEWLDFLPKAKKLYKETFCRTANYNSLKRFWEKKRT